MNNAAAGGTTPSATDVVMTESTPVGSGRAYTGISFHENANAGGNDGRVITGQSGTTALLGWTDLGTDDAAVDHTGEWTTDTVTESEWEVACTNIVSGTFTSAYAAVGTYTTLDTADITWTCNRITAGKGRTTGTKQVVADFTIREVADTSNSTTFRVTLTATQN
jgi:hypothetical protein